MKKQIFFLLLASLVFITCSERTYKTSRKWI